MNLRGFEEKIGATGYHLEYWVAQTLRRRGWRVTSNKYYVDDVDGSVREIDIVAHKKAPSKHVDVYTVLIISCKKSAANVWALLSRRPDPRDLQVDWRPLNIWTNERGIQHELSQHGETDAYYKEAQSAGVRNLISAPKFEVFAFQEMSRATGAPQNDRAIFLSITSLLKAQAYELSRLPKQETRPAVFQYNLISVFDGELVRLKFQGKKVTAQSIDSEHYIARYIISKKDVCSRIHFLRASALNRALADYSTLHTANVGWTTSRHHRFYSEAIRYWPKTMVFLDDFRSEISYCLKGAIRAHSQRELYMPLTLLSWSAVDSILYIDLHCHSEEADSLNKDTNVQFQTRNALQRIYHYDGPFRFRTLDH